MLTKSQVQKRLQEVSKKYGNWVNAPITELTTMEEAHIQKRNISLLEGEIAGLSWVLTYWDSGVQTEEK